MGGGLMQLVAYGAQDIYLTGNPQITFFKVVYRRHTNFSMEAIQQTFNGSVGTGESTVTATISRNGDLVSNMWLDINFNRTGMVSTAGATGASDYSNWTNNTGHAYIKECEIEIGGQRIDRHYSQWLDVWNELTDHNQAEWLGLNKHACKNAYLKSGGVTDRGTDTDGEPVSKVYVPLKFWFCRNPGLALPLIALQYHEVKFKCTFRALSNVVNGTGTVVAATTAADPKLWVDYIYLDTDERRRFAQVSHEYLIEQLQRDSQTSAVTHKLNFNHPVKELIWVIQDDVAASFTALTTLDATNIANESVSDDAAMTQGNDWFNYESRSNSTNAVKYINSQRTVEPFDTLKLQLNGHDRFATRDATYFRTCQPLQSGHRVPTSKVYCYSFALKPEEHQPSGTCNFSRIDNAQMVFTNITSVAGSTTTVYAINYNVLRIMSGMGGLAYSN